MAKEKLWAHELDRVWSFLAGRPRLGSLAVAHHGDRWLRGDADHQSGVLHASDQFEPYFFAGGRDDLAASAEKVSPGEELPWHLPKVIVSRRPPNRGAWVLTAVPDYSGLVASQDFYGVWPIDRVPAEVIAAILNGAVANAYVGSFGRPRDDGSGVLEDVPIPPLTDDLVSRIHDLVSIYRTERAHLRIELTQQGVDRCLELPETIEDLVLKAYRLPPAAETELLAYFSHEPRPVPGVLRHIASQPAAPMHTPGPEPMSPEETARWRRSIEEADAALEAGQRILEEQLRSERPDLFDESGAFREDVAQHHLEQHAARKKAAVRQELAALVRRRGQRPSDAS